MTNNQWNPCWQTLLNFDHDKNIFILEIVFEMFPFRSGLHALAIDQLSNWIWQIEAEILTFVLGAVSI